jgi:tetratricopeptide (TPR) repeat protein
VRPPLVFRSSQTASLVGWPDRRSGLDELLNGVRACLGMTARAKADQPAAFDRSVAVAPFSDSGANESSVHAAQLRGELFGLLSSYQELRALDVEARSLGDASYVVKANVSIAGDSVRVRAGLVRSSDQRSVWSQTFEAHAAEVAQAPMELATILARHVRLQLVLDHQVETVRRKSRVPEAVEYYRAAMVENYGVNQGGRRDVDTMLSNSRRAIELDPSIVEAYEPLAIAYSQLAGRRMSWREASELAHDALDRGQALEANNPLLHHERGAVQHGLDLDYDAAIASFEAAIAHDPLHPNARWFHNGLALVAMSRGDLPRALQHHERAVRIYDADMRVYAQYAIALVWSGAYSKALEIAQAGLRLGSRGPFAFALDEARIRAHLGLGHVREAIELLDAVVQRLGPRAWTSGSVASLLFQAGRRDDGLRIIDVLQRSAAAQPEGMPIAFRHVDHDVAFHWLHECIDAHAVFIGLRSDPLWNMLSHDARWADVIRHLEREEAGSGRRVVAGRDA